MNVATHVVEEDIEGDLHVVVAVIGRDVRRDDEVGGRPERRVRGQRQGHTLAAEA